MQYMASFCCGALNSDEMLLFDALMAAYLTFLFSMLYRSGPLFIAITAANIKMRVTTIQSI